MNENKQQLKADALTKLARLLSAQEEQLSAIDYRMVTYYRGLLDADLHNLYEILGAIKFLRILRTYPFKQKKVAHAIRLYEGEWKDGQYVTGSGGLMFSGLKGFTHYQMQPWQVYATAGLLGPHKDVDGDISRLCNELVLFLTRKSGKTQFSGFVMLYGFFFMDSNFEGFCCANSADQARLLYKTAQTLVRQYDVEGKRIRFTATQTNWKVGQPRQASFTALSAGGKTKDGLFAQLCCADEFGSAEFTNGKSDMLDLVSVVQSSMGPRREPLTVITTTAGYATNGPFHNQLEIMQVTLEEELNYADDYCEPMPNDYQHALLLQPDPWEQQNEEALLTDEKIWRKSNPMIGVSVQPSFYEQEAHKARQNNDNRKEFITKLVNVYHSDVVKEWIKPEQVRALQVNMRIDDCTWDNDWDVYAAFDFSHGDDFDAVTFLAINRTTREYFADCDAWVNRKAFNESPYHQLYVKWEQEGWLHVSGETVVDPAAPIARIMDLQVKGINFLAFGYDAYQSKEPILLLKEWLYNEAGMANPDAYVVPVSQTFANYNAAVGKVDYFFAGSVHARFSMSPLWPWEFSNCVLAEDTRMGNRKPVKRGDRSGNGKVDNIQCLCSCLILEESLIGNK